MPNEVTLQTERRKKLKKKEVAGRGVQDEPFQNVTLWYVDYFELKAVKTQQTQENFYLSLNYIKVFRQGAGLEGATSFYLNAPIRMGG